MKREHLGLILGGLIPALCFSVSSAVQKFATSAGISSGLHLVTIGLTTACVGAIVCLVDGDWTGTQGGIGYSCIMGFAWASGVGSIAIALKKYGAQISQLVPLYNMNTLFAVAIGLVVLGEWRTVQPMKIIIAAVLIISGGIVASRA